VRHLVQDDDLDARAVDEILQLARRAAATEPYPPGRLVVGLLFLAPSTRTSYGFAAATARLGGAPLTLPDVRATGEGLPPESLTDTLRVMSGMSDVVVCRPPRGASASAVKTSVVCPLVNGGDIRSHPTQALLDLHAVESLVGPVHELHLGISGDLRARTVQSLLHVLGLRVPKALSLFAPPGRELDPEDLPQSLRSIAKLQAEPDYAGLDVLLLPGLAPGLDAPLAADAHLRWGFSPLSAPTLPAAATVLSPGPVIDEIDPACVGDPRVRVAEQSDLGLAVRIGVLQWLLDTGSP
jgi:aspartate carbamoyltransferase catalytic subunit